MDNAHNPLHSSLSPRFHSKCFFIDRTKKNCHYSLHLEAGHMLSDHEWLVVCFVGLCRILPKFGGEKAPSKPATEVSTTVEVSGLSHSSTWRRSDAWRPEKRPRSRLAIVEAAAEVRGLVCCSPHSVEEPQAPNLRPTLTTLRRPCRGRQMPLGKVACDVSYFNRGASWWVRFRPALWREGEERGGRRRGFNLEWRATVVAQWRQDLINYLTMNLYFIPVIYSSMRFFFKLKICESNLPK